MHNQIDADQSAMELAESVLMQRLERDQIINVTGTALDFLVLLGLDGRVGARDLDLAINALKQQGRITAPVAHVATLPDGSRLITYLYLELAG